MEGAFRRSLGSQAQHTHSWKTIHSLSNRAPPHTLNTSGVGCHMGGHFTGALAYVDDITLLSPSMSGLRTSSKVCEEYATEFDITFNCKKVAVFQEVENVYFII